MPIQNPQAARIAGTQRGFQTLPYRTFYDWGEKIRTKDQNS